jgi:hypothetical protein
MAVTATTCYTAASGNDEIHGGSERGRASSDPTTAPRRACGVSGRSTRPTLDRLRALSVTATRCMAEPATTGSGTPTRTTHADGVDDYIDGGQQHQRVDTCVGGAEDTFVNCETIHDRSRRVETWGRDASRLSPTNRSSRPRRRKWRGAGESPPPREVNKAGASRTSLRVYLPRAASRHSCASSR